MLQVGLTGGYATGKSFIGQILVSQGCHLIEADELGHQALLPDSGAYQPVIDAFGEGILKEDGAINRKALGQIVFADPERLALLNSLVHPVVFRRIDERIAELSRNDKRGIAIVEAAIMFETGSYRRYHKVIVAACDREQQIERGMKRDGLTREQVEARLARQMPLEEKAALADYVIDTSRGKPDTTRQVAELSRELRRVADTIEH
jgi:dephospho-CoA kinase